MTEVTSVADLAVGESDDIQPRTTSVTINDGCDKPQYNWMEITEQFELAASELELGELLHDSNFGLFEAMSAIEMMDPKMDAGMMCNQTKRKVLNLEQSVKCGSVRITGLSLSEQIGIIDRTLACWVTWLEGHSLAQTVFTNLYLHDPCTIEDKCLKAFSINMLKTVHLIRERINRAGVYEEEDFQPMSYGFKMASEITDVRVSGMMKEVEDDLNKLIKNTRSKVGEDRDEETQEEHELAVALQARIKFCRLFFTALVSFSKDKCQVIEDCERYLSQTLELLPLMKKTNGLGIKPVSQIDDGPDYATIMGFEPLVNQRLLPPTFPRYTKIKSHDETMEYIEGLVNRLHEACKIKDYTNFHNALTFFMEFSKKAPCVISRSILQLIYLPPNRKILGSNQFVDILRDTIRNFIAPPGLMQRSTLNNNVQVKEYIDTFLSHAVRPMSNMLQLTGHNRARQRDKWAMLLEELAALQDEADKVDAYLHGLLVKTEPNRQHLVCFGTWVLYHTLETMIRYTMAGFELELYAPHEYHYIYWYLYECLYNWLISTLSRAETFVLDQEALADQQKGGSKKKGKKKRRTRPHWHEITINQVYQNLCTGYYKAVIGFTLSGKLKEAVFELDCEEVRFNHRFAPFRHVLTPPVVQYAQFKEMTDMNRYDMKPPASEMYLSACKYFQQAKNLLESLPQNEEVLTLVKIAKTNFVVTKLLGGGHKHDSKDPPEFDFGAHKLFPIIKIS